MKRPGLTRFVAFAGFALAATGSATGTGQPASCFTGSPIPDPTDPRCLKVPTSLPCVTPVPNTDGWVPVPQSNCGFKRCFWIFFCPCGRPLAGEACI
jgi:hypothetical protein